jgi:hypothetical protein
MSEERVTSNGHVTFKRIECPFDLEAIFTMQFDTSGLKSVLQFILEHIGTLDTRVAEHQDRINK